PYTAFFHLAYSPWPAPVNARAPAEPQRGAAEETGAMRGRRHGLRPVRADAGRLDHDGIRREAPGARLGLDHQARIECQRVGGLRRVAEQREAGRGAEPVARVAQRAPGGAAFAAPAPERDPLSLKP